jgi:outer membrane lipoprotein-sorting protein
MKKQISIPALAILLAGLVSAYSQSGAQPQYPQFGNGIEKLYGSNQTFSATMAMQINNAANGNPTTMSGKMSFDKGNSRYEMDMSEMTGGDIPPQAVAQMKSMGLDRMVTISQPDKEIVYVIYPNAQAYTEMTPAAPDSSATNSDAKIETTELGKEIVDGHSCVKNKAVLTDKQGQKHEFTVWNASDLKNFPIKVQMNEQGNAVTMSYQDITFSKPDASLFNPPTGCTRYDSMQEMMQAVMMKKMGGTGFPPQQQ